MSACKDTAAACYMLDWQIRAFAGARSTSQRTSRRMAILKTWMQALLVIRTARMLGMSDALSGGD